MESHLPDRHQQSPAFLPAQDKVISTIIPSPHSSGVLPAKQSFYQLFVSLLEGSLDSSEFVIKFLLVLDGESTWIGVIQRIIHVYDQFFIVGEALGSFEQTNSHLLFMKTSLFSIKLEELL